MGCGETAGVIGSGPVTTPASATRPDRESREWVRALRAPGADGRAAMARLHEHLLRGARFEVARRRPGLPHLRGDELADIAMEAADDALMSILRRLDDYRGESRFTTWTWKFALLEAATRLRRRAWQGRELPLPPEDWERVAARASGPHGDAETGGAAGGDRRRDQGGPDGPSAGGAAGAGGGRGADRRARGAPRHHPRRPLQDAARRAAPAAGGARGARPRAARGAVVTPRRDPAALLAALLGPGGPGARLRRVLRRARPLRRGASWPAGTPTRWSPGCAPTWPGAPPAARSTPPSTPWRAAGTPGERPGGARGGGPARRPGRQPRGRGRARDAAAGRRRVRRAADARAVRRDHVPQRRRLRRAGACSRTSASRRCASTICCRSRASPTSATCPASGSSACRSSRGWWSTARDGSRCRSA